MDADNVPTGLVVLGEWPGKVLDGQALCGPDGRTEPRVVLLELGPGARGTGHPRKQV